MAAEETINLYVTIHVGCPELHAALRVVPRRLRAERLRLLATLGLASLRGEVQAPAIATPDATSSPQDPQRERKVRLLGRLES